MQEKFELLKNKAIEELKCVNSSKELFDLKAKFVGKNGEITALLRGMKDVPADKRADFGKMVNDLKVEVSNYFDEKKSAFCYKWRTRSYGLFVAGSCWNGIC